MFVTGFVTKWEGIAVMKDENTGGRRTVFIVFNATDNFSLLNTYSYYSGFNPEALTTYESGGTALVFLQGNWGNTNELSMVGFYITNMFSLHSHLIRLWKICESKISSYPILEPNTESS
jgi:hypothetical protein